jgi:1-deoxy-D-xylulose-5-phosphate reductoisomerase
MGLPDMKLPIQYALGYPQRIPSSFPRFSFLQYPQLTFEAPDKETFRCLDLAYQAMNMGGTMPCVLNAANEIAVSLFLKDQISFLGIADLVEKMMEHHTLIHQPSIEDYMATDAQVRQAALQSMGA